MVDYVAGSVIVCAQCWHPIYALERSLWRGCKAGRSAGAFRPLTRDDFVGLLAERPDVPVAWQRHVFRWLRSESSYRTLQAPRPRSGDEMKCPHCGGLFARFEDREHGSVVDRGYVWELLDIPPLPATRGRMDKARWLEDIDPTAYDIEIEERPVSDSRPPA